MCTLKTAFGCASIDVSMLELDLDPEAALSYLGMGAEIGTPTWGKLLSDANSYVSQPPYFALVFFPGLMIFLTVLGFTTMGDGLRDAIDPRMKV